MLVMSQRRKWDLAASDVASEFLNTPVDESKGLTTTEAPREFSIFGADCLETQR